MYIYIIGFFKKKKEHTTNVADIFPSENNGDDKGETV